MTKQVQRRRGTATQHTSFTGAEGEISVNTTNKSVHVHDGSTAGGIEAARADLTNVADADLNTALSGNTLASLTITSADINGGNIDGTTIGANSAAAITGTTITGTSFVSSGNMTLTGTVTADGLTVDGGYIAVSGASTGLLIKETDTTDLNTWLSNQGGDLRLFTVNDALSVYTKRMEVDHATGDISFYEDTGTTAKFFWDASAESLGIGTTSPDTSLDVVGGSADSVVDTLTLKNDSTGSSAGVGLNFVIDGVNDVITSAIYGQRTGAAYHQGSLQFLTKDNAGGGLLERMRIDSSGHVLVGTTDTNGGISSSDTDGSAIALSGSTGQVYFTSAQATANAGSVGYFNRKTTDGEIVQFRKDGSTVGSIGTGLSGGSEFGIKSNTGELQLASSYNSNTVTWDGSQLYPSSTNNLGASSAKWQDLYLSGGVYLGGTGSANKLDDYETGTFTPVLRFNQVNYSGTYTDQIGRYTKVGNAVHYMLLVQLGTVTQTGAVDISGLPFTANSDQHTAVAIYKDRIVDCMGIVIKSNNRIALYDVSDSTGSNSQLVQSDLGTSPYIQISGWYRT